MFFLSALPVVLTLLPSILASPFGLEENFGRVRQTKNKNPFSACSLRHVTLPSQGLKAFTQIPGDSSHPKVVVMGVGVQNYTCTSAGTYSNVGAVATLFDISCLLDSPILSSLAPLAADIDSQSLFEQQGIQDFAIGHHYFVNFNGTLSPRFDISHKKDVPLSEFLIGKKLHNVASPDGPNNVDLLQLTAIEGKVAHSVYRLFTAGGQPPSTCSPGSSDISVNYAAQYWYFRA